MPTIFNIADKSSVLMPVLLAISVILPITVPKFCTTENNIIIVPAIPAAAANSGLFWRNIKHKIAVAMPIPIIFTISTGETPLIQREEVADS